MMTFIHLQWFSSPSTSFSPLLRAASMYRTSGYPHRPPGSLSQDEYEGGSVRGLSLITRYSLAGHTTILTQVTPAIGRETEEPQQSTVQGKAPPEV